MAGVMDQIRPNVSVGQQPNQNMQIEPKDPEQVPQGTVPRETQSAAQDASQAPQPAEDLASKINSQPDEAQSLADRINSQSEETDKTGNLLPTMQESSGFGDYFKNMMKAEVQAFKAGVHGGASRDQAEEISGLHQVYGKDNVKLQNGDVYIKPEGAKSFRKLDEGLIDTFAKFMDAKFNSADVARLAGRAIGGGGQAVIQGAGTTAGGISGAPGGLPGAMAGATAGTYAGIKASRPYEDWLNDELDQKDPNFKYDKQYNNWLDKLQSPVAQSIIGGVTFGGAQYLMAQNATKAAAALKGISTEDTTLLKNATPTQDFSARVNSALNSFLDVFTPRTETEEGASRDMVSAAMAARDSAGKKAALVTDAAHDLATVNPEEPITTKLGSFSSWAKEKLQNNGYKFDSAGQVLSDEAPKFGSSELNKIATLYTNASQEGLTPGQLREVMNDFAEDANFKGPNRSNGEKALGNAWIRMSQDRDQYYTGLFQGSGRPEETGFLSSLKNYDESQKAVKSLNQFLGQPQNSTEAGFQAKTGALSDNIVNASNSKDAKGSFKELLANLDFLGKDGNGQATSQLRNLKADVMQGIKEKISSENGVNTDMLRKVSNGEMFGPAMEFALDGNEDAIKAFKTISNMSQALESKTTPGALKRATSAAVDFMVNSNMPAKKAVSFVSGIINGNAPVLDALPEAIADAYEKAYGPEQKQALMEISNARDRFVSQSKLMGSDIFKGKNHYVPIAGAEAQVAQRVPNQAQQMMSMPQMAPSIAQSPQQQQPMSQ